MKKSKKCALLVALVMIITGAAIFLVAFAIAGFNFENLSTEKIATQNVEIKEQFQRISICSYEYDLMLFKSEDEKCRVVFTGNEKQLLVCNVEGTELIIDLHDTRKWYEKMEYAFQKDMGISVFLPEKEYDALFANSYSGGIGIDNDFTFDEANIETSSGNIEVSGMTAEKLDIQSYSGKIDISEISATDKINIGTQSGAISAGNVNASNIAVNSYSGKVNLENSVAETLLSVETTSGNVIFNNCDAGEISVNTYSGSVSGTLLSDKIFLTSTHSGSINVPTSSGTEKCTINTSSGNIKINVQ